MLPRLQCSGWEGGSSWRVDTAELVRQRDRFASSDGEVCQAVGVYFPPMLLKDTELCGEYDGVDAPKGMGEGAINLTEWPGGSLYSGGSARAKGTGGAAHGVVLPCMWWGETFPGNTGEWVDEGDGRGARANACAYWGVNAISWWEGGHQDRREPPS
jgi:hypothetical protein